MLHALVVAMSVDCDFGIYFDCTAAAHTAQVEAYTQNAVAQAAAAVRHVLDVMRKQMSFHHVKSHTGQGRPPINDQVPKFLREGLFAWLWIALPETRRCGQLPSLSQEDGTFVWSGVRNLRKAGRLVNDRRDAGIHDANPIYPEIVHPPQNGDDKLTKSDNRVEHVDV